MPSSYAARRRTAPHGGAPCPAHDLTPPQRQQLALDALAGTRTVTELARQGLQQPPAKLKVRGGFPVLPKRSGVVVTNDFINRLRQEEGI